MTLYGDTCPMCCGDLDDLAYLRTGVAVCLFCGCKAEASASIPSRARRPDAKAFSVSAIAMRDPAAVIQARTPSARISPSHDIQIQASAGMALAQIENVSTVPG
jgi:hypothetical protein